MEVSAKPYSTGHNRDIFPPEIKTHQQMFLTYRSAKETVAVKGCVYVAIDVIT